MRSQSGPRSLLFLTALLLPAVVTAAPAQQLQEVLRVQSGDNQVGPTSHRKLHGRFLHITDFHPDGFYKVHTLTEDACHRGKGSAGEYGTETSDCDSPHSLVNATFDWIATNLKDSIDFVVWTGDSARHDSDEDIPRTEKEVVGSNRMLAEKFVDTFSDSTGLSIPVIPTFGNNDILPHNVMEAGPNKWLKTYANVWKSFIPEAQRHSFEFGGWFYTEVIPDKLAVFSLNTLYFFDRNAGVDNCVDPGEPGFLQFEWLRIQLGFLRERGMKAILMGHVPPARTEGKQMWDETCWQKYTLWLQQYRDVIVGSVYGHMNIDHFFLQDTKDIDLALLGGEAEEDEPGEVGVREAFDDELEVHSSSDYLRELRNEWASLPKTVEGLLDDIGIEKKKKKKKKGEKDIGGPWAERFQLSFVSPSIVPNFFPTLRVFEYNITGLGNTITWSELARSAQPSASGNPEQVPFSQVRSRISANEKEEKDQKKKHKKPKDPNLVIPDPPTKATIPGPAYSPQTLTLTGYTQYFANLTLINAQHEESNLESNLKSHPFKFEVEYSTFKDKIYKLQDLTVRSILDLAYRIGRGSTETNDEVDDWNQEFDAEGGKKKKKKGKGHKKHKDQNKVWLHFLRHAFVSTRAREELQKI